MKEKVGFKKRLNKIIKRSGVEEDDLSKKRLAFSSVQFSRSVVSDSWRPHGLQHTRLA